MSINLSSEEEKILQDVKRFIEKETSLELLQETHQIGSCYGGKLGREFIQKFAEEGWLTPNWKHEEGGLGLSTKLTFAIKEELAYARVPSIFVAAHMAGPIIKKFANDEQIKKWIPLISSGKVEFALGYTEPQAGSDLAQIKIHAEEHKDYYVINGQKTFNTHAHVADYHWLAARTELSEVSHRGISMFIVDLKSPGITIRPMKTVAGWTTNEVFYDDLVVPKENLIGEKNKGFYYMMSALDFERMFPLGSYERLFNEVLEYTKTNEFEGKRIFDQTHICKDLAKLKVEIEVNRLLYFQLAEQLDQGKIPNDLASIQKLFATELAQKIARKSMDILGVFSLLKTDDSMSRLKGEVENLRHWSIVETIYAGTSEIQRNIIARANLDF